MIKRKEEQLVLLFIGCLLISLAFSLAYKYDNEHIVLVGNVNDYHLDSDSAYSWYIDSISKTEKQYVIEGWIAKLGKDLDYVDRTIVLITSQGQIYRLNTVMVNRASVTDYFKDGHNYDNSGIRAAVLLNELNAKGTYTIGIIVKEKDGSIHLIKTDKTIAR